jgi:uncharacterized OB-fold protein
MAYSWKPQLNYDTAAYWDGCTRKELMIARCEDCKYWIHPPKALCPSCWSDNIGHEKASGKGSIFSFTVMPSTTDRRMSLPPLGESNNSNVTVWAELDEQQRLFLVGDLQGGYVEGVEIGDRVETVWVDFHGSTVPGFRRVNDK